MAASVQQWFPFDLQPAVDDVITCRHGLAKQILQVRLVAKARAQVVVDRRRKLMVPCGELGVVLHLGSVDKKKQNRRHLETMLKGYLINMPPILKMI